MSYPQTPTQKRLKQLENQVNKLRGQLEIQGRINEQVTRLLGVLERRTRSPGTPLQLDENPPKQSNAVREQGDNDRGGNELAQPVHRVTSPRPPVKR